jgi:hypothetical protein
MVNPLLVTHQHRFNVPLSNQESAAIKKKDAEDQKKSDEEKKKAQEAEQEADCKAFWQLV